MPSPPDSGYRPVERRRHPRVPADLLEVSIRDVKPVELLDISSAGALLSTEADLHVGQRAQLRTLLEREPFSAWVEVRRLAEGSSVGTHRRHRLGIVFTSFDENSRKVLQRFVRSNPHQA